MNCRTCGVTLPDHAARCPKSRVRTAQMQTSMARTPSPYQTTCCRA